MEINEKELISQLQKRESTAFEQVFKTYYKNLHGYAFAMLKEEAVSEEMVQNVFYKIWERSEKLQISGSIAAYLYSAVHNECLNYIKHLKVRKEHSLYVSHTSVNRTPGAAATIQAKELENTIRQALNDLPEQCRTVFQLSRFEQLRYREIADKLGISVKTVENHMGKALKFLKSRLSEFIVLILFFINSKY